MNNHRKIDQNKIARHFTELKGAVDKLIEISRVPLSDFLKDRFLIDAAKYNFIVAIESVIDIANHLVAKMALGKPADYADVMKILSSANIVSEDLQNTLIKMVKFRNLLVHLYWEVDNQKVYNILINNIKDFKNFESAIRKFLNSIS